MYLIHHVFLLPKTPQKDDFDPNHEKILLKTTRDALQQFEATTSLDRQGVIASAGALIDNLRSVQDDSGSISEQMLEDALRELPEKGGVIPLHIRAQNAGVIITKAHDTIHFEAFELSPCNESVITTRGRLRRSFPGAAFAVRQSTFDTDGFKATLAQTIAKMSHQVAMGMQPKVRKAGQQHTEDRDTTHPSMVTEYLMSFLRAAGEPAEVSTIWKNTREEVMWKSALRPWRRSPTWLLIRVVLQLWFSRSVASAKSPEDLYKAFMVFLLAHILNDILSAMNAKLSRRLLKLGAEQTEPWIKDVHGIMLKTQNLIERRWQDVIKQTNPKLDLTRLKSLKFKDDTILCLPELDDYIVSIARRERQTSHSTFQPLSVLPTYLADQLPSDIDAFAGKEYQVFRLAAFESWVDLNLPSWLKCHMNDDTTCGRLKTSIEDYHNIAASYYSNNPEASSIMVLTIMELWVACDKSACIHYGLLLDYSPEIPTELLQCLMLPFKRQMKRLSDIEQYLKTRQGNAKATRSVFRSFGQASDFSVRFFNQSPQHQALLSRIEDWATLQRDQKRAELFLKKEQYSNLMRLHDQSECEYDEVVVDVFNDFRESRHSSSCKKHRYKNQAKAINIAVNEWPLPRKELEAKSTVFELMVPVAFGQWRDETAFILNDVLGCKYSTQEHPRAKHTLSSYPNLVPFNSSDPFRCIGLLSEVKPHTATHRRDKSIADTTEGDICLHNGLQWKYYDRDQDVFTSTSRTTDRVLKLCTYSLPERSILLAQFLARPPQMPSGVPPNQVIASQSDCPDHMSLDEFKAFCAIPLGYRIQWMNIMTQLAIPSLDFTKVETNIMLLGTIYQAGPPGEGNVERMSHAILANEAFSSVFLVQVHVALQRVKANWEASRALASFVHLAARLLSLTSAVRTREEYLKFLDKARQISFTWVDLLRDKAQHSTDDDQRTEFLSRTIEVALVCVNTFDIDQNHLEDTLASPSEASILIQCSLAIQEYSRSLIGQDDQLQSVMLERWKKLLYRALPILTREVVEMGSPCLNDAVTNSWSAYEPGSTWQPVPNPHTHWLYSQAVSEDDCEPLVVHFNLLTAELLVNGLPLARLPQEYERHAMYTPLFGRSTLEVMPTRTPGMRFSAKQPYAGYTVYFGMQSTLNRLDSHTSDLVLQSVRNGYKYDLVPSSVFRNTLPIAFVDEYAHWYDNANNSVEFRPIKDPWSSSLANWRLTNISSSWRLTRDDSVALIDLSSDTARNLSTILSPLEESRHIHAIFHEASESLEIELPRLQLGFDLEQGTSLIHSRQFRGMSIDPNQVIGTLVGLRNTLVLKKDRGDQDRLVIIPEGKVTYRKSVDHILVTIDRSSTAKAHVYHVDRRLGRMVDNGNLQSKLFLCYLHGLTSYCLPDTLTQRTGTEQALLTLNSAAVRSFDYLTENNLAILERIAKLAAGRTYYPANERVMQTVDWDSNLSFLSQHSKFYLSVKGILEQANDTKIFYPDVYIEPPSLNFVDPYLVERDLIRSSTFRVADFGAEEHTIQHDANYLPRDQGQNSERATRAFEVARSIFQGRDVLQLRPLPNLKDCLWTLLLRCGSIPGPSLKLEKSMLKFDSKWLGEPSELLGELWCPVHFSLGRSPEQYNKFHIMAWLSTMAFSKEANMQVIQTLTAFYVVRHVAQVSVPPFDQFDLSQGFVATRSELEQLIRSARRPFHSCPEARFPKQNWESESAARTRRHHKFQSNQSREIKRFVQALEQQWPCETPEIPTEDIFSIYINTGQIIKDVISQFKTWFKNHRFYTYLDQIEGALRNQMVDPIHSPVYLFPISSPTVYSRNYCVRASDIFAAPAPLILPKAPPSLSIQLQAQSRETRSNSRLDALLTELEAQASSKHENDYFEHLRDSLLSLQGRANKSLPDSQACEISRGLESYQTRCNQHVEDLYLAIINNVRGGNQVHSLAATVGHWPRVSPAFFLQQLTCPRWVTLSDDWKKCIIKYGLALTEVSRAERLIGCCENHIDLAEELFNVGHQNWSPWDFPESLLLEVESGIMIREVQEEIARQMANPRSNDNAVMQLNMGEGKSSVIVPIVAAALADGTRLVRVIVAKPQSRQMFRMLVSKFGGLLGRRIYHMPFSRALRLETCQANAIGRIYRECMSNRGILLVQPEHILSFKLMGLECLVAGHESVGKSLLETQHFFDGNSRDIVDESDENFSVKFELIYTMGMQRPIELSPERWTIIQMVLDIVARLAPEVKLALPESIRVDVRQPGAFPKTRLLRPDAHKLVLRRMAEYICKTGFSGFPVARQPEGVRRAIFKYITELNLTAEDIVRVESESHGSFWTDSTKNALLLIRGLIAGGVLSFAFDLKQWRVNYGLDPNRMPKTQLAVPFRAKDNPTPRSEFSHPDVMIVLTSLSYYYGGLDDDDLFNAFSHLLKSDQAQNEYGEWVQTAPELPDSFRQLVGVNTKDRFQCVKQVFPHLRYSKGAIDYFLSRLVFPKEMKEFPQKLSASGWDLGQIKPHPTTGFSGTNDSRHLLPLSVHHLDLPTQKHTNALVLEYLLRDENSVELLPRGDAPTGSDAELLLSTVTKMDLAVRVILDVGAQILELSNLQIAQKWLSMSTDHQGTKAVVFFNDDDELSVLDRTGRIELLQTSPFAEQLDVCLVILDEAHTRGTDLRLPKHYRAAVTLGPCLTKDRLVQACMRLRKLGKGQSVVFCIPAEIQSKILERTCKQEDSVIEVADVLRWAISETWLDLRRSMSLWAVQGRRFEEQKHLWAAAEREDGYEFSSAQAEEFLEEEAQTLDYRYRPHPPSETPRLSDWNAENENISRIIERCRDFGNLNFDSATLQEEQERELSPEIEQERQVERPPRATPEKHSIHRDVSSLVRTGQVIAHSNAFLPAFEALRTSSAAAYLDVSQFPHDLLVTADFARTIKVSGERYVSDAYQRPVQWIFSSAGGVEPSSSIKHMVIISPFEAQELLPLIQEYRRVTLHLYAPRPNLGFRPLDALDLFTAGKPFDSRCIVPRHVIVQLNLFAGQLYLSSFREYTELCDTLNLAWRPAEEGVRVRADGFITSTSAGKTVFRDSPVEFLKVLMTKIRRNCEGIEKTHLGKILQGGLLEETDFEDDATSGR
ncbi:MAG: hypothetical protein M1819_000796 [Sarea resinae]|nr:MAG: hypothetical protein M1819_000796 [Sarea resinae]